MINLQVGGRRIMATVQSLITGRLQVTVGINVTVRESRFEKTVKNSYQFCGLVSLDKTRVFDIVHRINGHYIEMSLRVSIYQFLVNLNVFGNIAQIIYSKI